MKEYKMICPNCGTIYNAATPKKQNCVKCGVGIVYSGFTRDEYDAKSAEEQREIYKNVRAGKITGNPVDVKNDSFWISFVDKIVNIFIILGVLASVIGGIVIISNVNALLGIVVVVFGVLITLLSVAMTKILL